MTAYANQNSATISEIKASLETEYAALKDRKLALNMARGKPSSAQLDLSMPLLDIVATKAEDGLDARNYGVLDGLFEAKQLMANILDDSYENVIIFGNASLNIMYDTMARCWMFGTLGSTPWCQLDKVKWICPCPGYDRHFAVTEAFGIEMIPVAMTENGLDMDEIERIASSDSTVKGIWCVPKYSNPGGVTYSDETVRRLASMTCAAKDFRIFWDNAYGVHHLYDENDLQDDLLDIACACKEAGNPDRYFKFASTSKITFPGAGIAAMASSPANVAEIKTRMNAQTIGYDKLNQLRHVQFLRDAQGITEHMSKHAAILRPKFQLVVKKLEEGLKDVGGCSWSNPRGGYFVSFNAPEGTATRIVALAKEAGVVMTGAGATYPYGHDPYDSNIRIAPSLPPLEELEQAMEVFICCVKLAYAEKLLQSL